MQSSGHYPVWEHRSGVTCGVGEPLHGRLAYKSGPSREGREPRGKEPGRAGVQRRV